MSTPNRGNVIITFNPKWVAGLVAFMADPDLDGGGWDLDLYGIQFHPVGDHGAVIVAGSRSAIAVVQDPETTIGGHGGKPVVVNFSGDFAKACRVPKVTITDVNGDRRVFNGAPWATPKQVLVTAFGLNEPNHQKQVTWRIEPFADPPGVNPDTAQNMGWSIGAGIGDARWVESHRIPWEKVVEELPRAAVDQVAVQPRYLAYLRHFGRSVTLTFHEDLRLMAKFEEAPEVTIAFMPIGTVTSA